jgi:tol-pal system protein YbgF
MRYLSKVFAAGGLVLMIGPLSLMARAQSYIDVEAERAAQRTGSEVAGEDAGAPSNTSSTSTPVSPYGSQPAQSYPATSYGLNNAPAAPVSSAPVSAGATGGVGAGGQNLGNLFYQIQQLQQEVMRLNGKVEEQANELRKLKEQSAPAPSASKAPSGAAAIAGSSAVEQPGEGESYRAAYALVRGQQFNDAITAFQKFLRDYPDGKYAANAHYWLGELFLVVQPQDLEASRQSFTLLLDQYPDNNKAPDAMYKLGKVYFLKGNRERSREYMDRVISEYGSSGSSAVKLARDFITENY